MFKRLRQFRLNKAIKRKSKQGLFVRQTHCHANSIPKHLREPLEAKGIIFDKDDFVDIVEWIDIEVVNIWKKGS